MNEQTPGWVVEAAVHKFEKLGRSTNRSMLRLEAISQANNIWHVVLSHPKTNSIFDRYEKEIIVQ